MKKIIIAEAIHNYSNNGQHKQQCADYQLTGKIRHADHSPWDKDSDIPELSMSVKSDRFSLCASGQLNGETLEEMVADFILRVASEKFLYVTNEWNGYIMDKAEFQAFVLAFCKVTTDSRENKAGLKVKLHHETRKVREYLESRV